MLGPSNENFAIDELCSFPSITNQLQIFSISYSNYILCNNSSVQCPVLCDFTTAEERQFM